MRGPTIGSQSEGGGVANGHAASSLREQSASGESMAPADAAQEPAPTPESGAAAAVARPESVAAAANARPESAGTDATASNSPGAAAKPAAVTMPFLTDVRTLRERARRNIEEGALTRSYRGDAAAVVRVLNDALATEIVCTLRYRRHYFTAKGPNAEGVKAEFLEHANEEQEHADRIAERIVQLGGDPDFDPAGLASRSHAEYVPGTSLVDMIKEDLVAERIAIDSYREIVQWVAPFDPVTRALMEEILAKEDEHADELSDLLAGAG
jgi:bacterioferritin